MKAAFVEAHGGVENIRFGEFPDPEPGPGEVLVRIQACGLNHLDLFVLAGMPGLPVELPRIPGGDVAGVIAALGPGATGFEVGARVLIDPELGRGIDPHLNRNYVLGEHLNGGLCDYVAVPAANLLPLPDEVSFEIAAALPVAYGTAWRMMTRRGRVAVNEKVLVLGASGGVGTACVQIARMAGATVFAAASSDDKLERLKAIGADYGINYAREEFSRAVWQMSGKTGMDVIVNFTGGDTWVPSIKALKVGGRLLTCGASAGFDPKTDIRYIWRREISIIGCNSWGREDLEVMLDLAASGKVVPPIYAVYPLAETRRAFQALKNREVFGKVIVAPQKDRASQ